MCSFSGHCLVLTLLFPAAVREAKLVETLPSQADGDGSHTPDMMAFLSEDSAESTPDEL